MTKSDVIKRMKEKNFTESMIDQFEKGMSDKAIEIGLKNTDIDTYLDKVKEGIMWKEFNPSGSYAQWDNIANAHSCLSEIDVALYKTVKIGRIIENCNLKYDGNGTKVNSMGICKKTNEPVVSFRKESKANLKKYTGKDLNSGQTVTAAMLILNFVGIGEFEKHLKYEYGIDLGPIKDAKEKSMEEVVHYVVKNNETFKNNGKKMKLLISAEMVAKSIDNGSDGTYITFGVTSNKFEGTYNGQRIIEVGDCTSKKSFNASMGQFPFLGSEEELAAFYNNYLTENLDGVKYRNLLDSAGVHNIDGKWMYIDGKGYFDAEDNRGEDYVAAVFETQKKTAFRDVEKINAEELKEIWSDLLTYNVPEITCNVLFAVITLYFKEIHRKYGKINAPHINLSGESGAGKSGTLEDIINPLFGIHKTVYNKTASGTTTFALNKESSMYNTLPIIINEFKKTGMPMSKYQGIFDLIRNSYDKASTSKGKVTKKGKLDTDNYVFNAPMIIIGETYLNETATIERTIIFKFYKELNNNEKCRASFYRLEKKEKLLNKLGKRILCKALEMTEDKYHKMMDIASKSEIVKYALKSNSNRVAKNAHQMVAAMMILKDILCDLGLADELMTEKVQDKMMDALYKNIFNNSLNKGKKNLSDSDKIVEVLGRMIINGAITNEKDYIYKYNRNLKTNTICIRESAFDLYTEYLKKHNVMDAEVMGNTEFGQKVKMQSYYIGKKTVRGFMFGPKVQRAHILDLCLMEKAGINFPFGWEQSDEDNI